ncbi:aminotransferase class I/II-fold pyridoxal phosphate-dependent enzyme [Clostridium tyrobutyricum]|jgi:O-acetylhomoserine (thiol)-lyase|uniref:homocysteine desulfhydrase n=1 Tax=Clostridium tyrobutyricum DIVETGP TaxID=1408889 RepID=W6N2W8_CLOTY|nr:aminotransferase class I/II-fold pyridoxal phosphate-dependent enzyme [Clostridium tyrobutyricum]AND84748.1 O-acetylhomoserine (thiol)-lyase [Clostridium tyrobutyricum]ANP69339.1 O-acetylhomoserine aminocarboxypropyltransferase [Clostridium tyrobutyricum]MBV4423530.1 aminotransferase class I/II-fold pyridoxal phosphate-dependent enzyme [Clostridium tyrobutyricum]MBV4427375.1 aminotransferase class I/II-fold pyridoxal phosphate-dependent enzyme [Clostridium tyrobutyricum]MBV4435171.1 aminotr
MSEVKKEELKFDTLKVRGGYDSSKHNHSVSVPIYETAAFDLGSTDRAKRLFSFSEPGFIYTRLSNPTVEVLEQRVAALDGASGAIALSSGMAAITYTLLNLAEDGGRILTTPYLYGGTLDGFKKLYPKFGIDIDKFHDFNNPEAISKEIKPDTKAIFIESISNPNTSVSDIETIAKVAHEHDIPLVVDNTFATPYLLNPIKYGADIVIYSATKALNGHGNVIAGLILESGKFNWGNGKFNQFLEPYYTLRDNNDDARNFLEVFPDFPFTTRIRLNYLNYFGSALSPFDAYLALLGIETLSERVKKQIENTEKIINYLKNSTKVSWIKYPTLENNPYKKLADKYLPKGAGSIFTFGFKGTDSQIDKFINSLKIFSYHTNVGDSRSLIVNSPKTTHSELTPEEKQLSNILPNTIRLSIGLEDAEDLIHDLNQAFEKAFESEKIESKDIIK